MASQTILITGASAGFGWACAERFAKEGWKLILTGRRRERLEFLAQQLAPASVHTAVLDVREAASIEAKLAGLPADFAAIDVLLNNAGLALGMAGAQEASLDDWNTMIDTNIRGLCTLTRLVLPGMIERDRGHIINLGSIAGTYPYPGGNVYGASKAFVKQFSRNLQADLVHTPLRVTNIEPGLAESEFSIVRFHGDASKAGAVYQGSEPLRPVDIAEIVYWVSSVPPHVNICAVEVMPTCQSCGPLFVHRQSQEG